MTSLRKNSKKTVFVSSAAALSNLKNVNLGDAVSTYLTRSIVAFKEIKKTKNLVLRFGTLNSDKIFKLKLVMWLFFLKASLYILLLRI